MSAATPTLAARYRRFALRRLWLLAALTAVLLGALVLDVSTGPSALAFADVFAANEVRRKLEGIGLKTYTQAVNTKDGQRIRVRVGPFTSRDEAQKAADRAKSLGLAGAVLTL